MNRASSLILAALLASACVAPRAVPGVSPTGGPRLSPGWSIELEAGGPMDLVAVPGGFVAISGSGKLFRVEAERGEISWSVNLDEPPAGVSVSSGAEAGGGGWVAVPLAREVVVVAAADGGVVARIPRSEGGALQISATEAGLLLLDSPSRAELREPGSGVILWTRELPAPASAPGTSCRGQIVVGLESGLLAGLDSSSGELRWSRRLGSPAAAPPACAGRHLSVATADNNLHALRLHRRSAGKMWKMKTGADPAAAPIFAGRSVLLPSKDTYLYGMKRRNGHLVFRIRLGRRPGPAAIVGDLVLVSGAQATRLEAYRLPLGYSAGGFDVPVGSRFVTPPILSGGTLAMGVVKFGVADRSRLIAIGVDRSPSPPAPADPDSGGQAQ